MKALPERTATVIIDTLQLALGVIFYAQIDPFLSGLLPNLHLLAHVLSAILAALITLGIFWLTMPFSLVQVEFTNYTTRGAIAGPQIELACSPEQSSVGRYDLDITYQATGILARRIMTRAARAGARMEIVIKSDLLVPHVANGGGSETDRGVAVPLVGSLPHHGTWQWTSMSFDSNALPATGGLAEVEASIHVDGRGGWFARWWIRPRCSIKTIHVVRT